MINRATDDDTRTINPYENVIHPYSKDGLFVGPTDKDVKEMAERREEYHLVMRHCGRVKGHPFVLASDYRQVQQIGEFLTQGRTPLFEGGR